MLSRVGRFAGVVPVLVGCASSPPTRGATAPAAGPTCDPVLVALARGDFARAEGQFDDHVIGIFFGHVELGPSIRSHGIGWPGYSVGWFRLRGGKRALVFLTHARRFVAIDTNAGYLLLPGGDHAAPRGCGNIGRRRPRIFRPPPT